MTANCHVCGAEMADDAKACWNCDTPRQVKPRSKAPLLIILGMVVAAALGGGAWWLTTREGGIAGLFASVAPAPAAAEPTDTAAPATAQRPDLARAFPPRAKGKAAAPAAIPSSTTEVPPKSEAILLADPIDGPFYVEFNKLLPADYGMMVGPILAQVPDPARDAERFDQLLSDSLETFQQQNAGAIAAAEAHVLVEMATNLEQAMRTPEICQAAMQTTYQPLPRANLEARRIAAASNVSLVRAVASGRQHAVQRQQPDQMQQDAFNKDLRKRLTPQLWDTFAAGQMASLPVADQCSVMAAYWAVIAGYPPEQSAQWTAFLMRGAS